MYANTLNELRDKERLIAKDLDDNIVTDLAIKNMTLNDLFKRYLSITIIGEGTKSQYRTMWDAHVADTIGGNKVVNVRMSHLLSVYSKMANEGYAHSTIKYIHMLISPTLELALNDDIIRKNPAKRVDLSDYGKESKNKNALTISEQERLLMFAKKSNAYKQYVPMLIIMMETALRCGELIGLTYEDVDLKNKELRVERQLTYRNYNDGNGCIFRIKRPKSKAGIRTIPLTERACVAFKEQRKLNFQLGVFCSTEIDDVTDFIFLSKHGRPMMPAAVNNVLYNILRAYNKTVSPEKQIEHFSSHVMRHTGCTNMARAGVNVKAAQYVMGHAHSDVTMDVYNHLNNLTDVKNEFQKIEKFGTKMVQ